MAGLQAILVMETDPNVRSTLAQIMRRAGHQVVCARTGDEAIRLLRDCEFGLVLIGLNRSEAPAVELIKNITGLRPPTPVLVLAGQDPDSTELKPPPVLVWDYLIKPADPSLILRRVEDLLGLQVGPPGDGDRGAAQPGSLLIGHFLERGPFLLDLQAQRVLIGELHVPLSSAAFRCLVTLARHAPEPVPASVLVQESERLPAPPERAATIASNRIYALRQACEPNPAQPRYIVTVRTSGYCLNV